MTAVSDFVTDLRAQSEIAEDGDRSAVPVTAVVANVSPDGEAISLSVNDTYADLALGGQRYRTPTEFQLDVYTSSYPRLTAIKDQIIDRYHGKALVLGDTTFHKLTVTSSIESASTLNDTIYRVIILIEAIT